MSVRLTQWKIAAAIGIAVVSGITGATSANATVRIGSAMLIERDVSGSISGQLQKVVKGDDVFENEFIRTEIASQARLLFIDKTQLVLGPTASARLDRLVFNPDQSVNTLAVNARAGAIRWISGDSPSSAYLIETPVVTIRPHGTIFDLLVEPQRTTVVLQEGIIEVCLIDAPQHCRVLSRKGEFISATRADIEAPREGGPGSSDFEDRCLSAASKECIIGKSANPPPEPPQKPGTGEKRAEPRAPSNAPSTVTSDVDPTPVVNAVRPGEISPPVTVTTPFVPPRIWIRSHHKPSSNDTTPSTSTRYPRPPTWSDKAKGSPTPPTSTGRPRPPTWSDKGKGSAGMYKSNLQILHGSIGDNPRLRVNSGGIGASRSFGRTGIPVPSGLMGLFLHH